MTATHTHSPQPLAGALSIAIGLSLLSACVAEGIEDSDRLVPKSGCSQTNCGSNSPSLGDYSLAEVHQDVGAPVKGATPATSADKLGGNKANQDGLYLKTFVDPWGSPAQYHITSDGELQITDPTGQVLSGAQVVGSIFHIGNNDNSPDLYLHILNYRKTIPYWVGTAENIHSYEMTYTANAFDSPTSGQSLCPGPYTEPANGEAGYRDVVFSTGERHNFTTRKIFDTGAPSAGWANLACLGDGPSKSLLYRHRPETPAADPYGTPVLQRQALLRLWAADYCGTGKSFTYQGHPLEFEDRDGWMTANQAGATVEAVWDQNGVACLDVPRWEKYSKSDVEQMCGKSIPSCSHPDYASWATSYYFKTWNPPVGP